MKGAVLLAIVAFCGLVERSQGVTCIAATGLTCAKSVHVTGTCSSGNCACSSSTEKGPFGCQVKQKPSLSTNVIHFNGQIKTGEGLTLTCQDKVVSTGAYAWTKGGVAEAGETSKTLAITTASTADNGEYKCTSPISGIASDPSDGITVDVVAPSTKPIVTGMPTKAVSGMTVVLTCTNIPSGGATFTWTGATGVARTSTYTFGTTGEEVKCTETVQSDGVTAPASFDADIDGVALTVSADNLIAIDNLELTCKLTGGFPEQPGGNIVTIEFFQGSTSLSSGNTYTYTVSSVDIAKSGDYKCTGMVSGQTLRTSSVVTVTVTENMDSAAIKASNSFVLTNGYLSLTCDYKTVDTTKAVTYKWFLGGTELPGVTDSMVQINEPGTDFDGAYTCSVTSTYGTVMHTTATTISAKAISDPSAKPTVTGATAPFGIGNSYKFTCQNNFHQYGVTYKWKVDSAVQSETSNTFTYKATDSSVDIKCTGVFRTADSSESDAVTVLGKKIISVSIQVSGQTINSPTPVAGAKVKFSCNVVTAAGISSTVTYQWKEGSTAKVTTKEYEWTATAATVAKVIKCEATYDSVTESSQLTVTPSATAAKPAISVNPATVYIGSKVTMTCLSNAHAEGATFIWKKGSTAITGATALQYTINDAAASYDGDYTCTVTSNSQTSSASSIANLEVKDHLACTWARDCNLDNMDSTKCTNKKCACKSGYTFTAGQCSGAATIVGSLLVMLVAVIVQRLF